jgi:hypothetical protein
MRENVRVYDKLFRIYQDLYGNLKHSFDQISKIYSLLICCTKSADECASKTL